jgi:hypothetical protein
MTQNIHLAGYLCKSNITTIIERTQGEAKRYSLKQAPLIFSDVISMLADVGLGLT